MKLGIKVNADAESFDRLTRTDPAAAEVWFNVNDSDRYTGLFDELAKRDCDVGLHFWGTVSGTILPNLAYPDSLIIRETLSLMKKTIDIASARGFSYVNIHPGSSALLKVDYAKQRYDIEKPPIDTDRAISLFLESAHGLNEYARRQDVVFTVETVPSRITDGWYTEDARHAPKNAYELPVRAIIRAAATGIPVANDFCHTAANIVTESPDAVWEFVYGATKTLAKDTRLIHLGFIIPPYNGTDNHDDFANPVFQTDLAIPNYHQTISLLSLFKNRDDIWILAEPKNNHAGNYFEVKKLLELANGHV